MPKFVLLLPQKKKLLIQNAKKCSKCTWTDLAKKLGCSRNLLFAYQKKTAIPLEKFQVLCQMASIEPDEFDYKTQDINNQARSVTIPKIVTTELCEFLGILAGDGHVSTLKYPIQVIGHKHLDREYLVKRVVPLMQHLFGTNPLVREQKNVMFCRISSKPGVEYLNNTFGVPLGKKKGRLRIPRQIMEYPEFLKAYLRGVFDTDGSIYPRREKDIVMDITSLSPDFREDLKEALTRQGFHPVINGKNVQLYRKEEIRLFFDEVRPANNKHLIKYQAWIKSGKLPKAKFAYAAVV